MLRLSAASRWFGQRVIFTDLDLDLSAGDRLLVAGPNGSGKTSLLRCLAGTQVTGRIVTERRAGTLEMLAGQPVPLWALAAGLAGYPFLVALLRTGVYLTLLAAGQAPR